MTTTAGRRRRIQSEARDHLEAGLRAMLYEQPEEARDHLEAAASLERLSSHDPTAIDALAYLSSVRFALADVEGARAAVELSMELGPERFAPNQKAGEMALRLGDPERAADNFLTALRACEPGSREAKAAERSLREARQRLARGVRHEAKAPRSFGWLAGLLSRRRPGLGHGSVTAGPQLEG